MQSIAIISHPSVPSPPPHLTLALCHFAIVPASTQCEIAFSHQCNCESQIAALSTAHVILNSPETQIKETTDAGHLLQGLLKDQDASHPRARARQLLQPAASPALAPADAYRGHRARSPRQPSFSAGPPACGRGSDMHPQRPRVGHAPAAAFCSQPVTGRVPAPRKLPCRRNGGCAVGGVRR